MQQVEVQRVFDAPIETVWARYTDHRSWTEWSGIGTVELERAGMPPPNGVGCVRVFSNAGIRLVYEEVVEFEPPRRMTYKIVRGPVPLKDHFGEVVLEPASPGTRLVWRARFESRIPGLGGLFRFFITRMFRQALDGLARDLHGPARS